MAVQPTVCDRDYEHLTKPGGSPLVGCTPNAAVPGNTVTNALNTKDPSLVYAQLFSNYQTDGMTSMANVPLSSSTNTGFLGLAPAAVVGQSMVSCESARTATPTPSHTMGCQGATTDTPYNADEIFRCCVAAYFDSALNNCFLDLKVLPLYTALCQNQEVAATCTCQGFVQDGIGCSPVVDSRKLQGICSNIELVAARANSESAAAAGSAASRLGAPRHDTMIHVHPDLD